MGLSTTAKNLMLDALGADAVKASLHTADPGATGASEVSGGSPAYARKTIAWGAASGSDIHNSSNPTFDVPASTTITHAGFWTSGGTWRGGAALSSSEVFTAQGQ